MEKTNKQNKGVVTFKISLKARDDFKIECLHEGVTMSDVVEGMIKLWTSSKYNKRTNQKYTKYEE